MLRYHKKGKCSLCGTSVHYADARMDARLESFILRFHTVYLDKFCFRINAVWKEASVFANLIGLSTEHEKILYRNLVQR